MKRYLVGGLAICLLASASMQFKQRQMNVFAGFDKNPTPTSEPTLFLYGFFSSDSCVPCAEMIGVLNQLPGYFRVFGVVPRREAPRIKSLKAEYRIRFPVYDSTKFRRYKPIINPTIIGASRGGKILFVFPCTTLEADEIRTFLMGFHSKLAPYLADLSF